MDRVCVCVSQEVEARCELSYPHFAQLYRTLMFDIQRSVSPARRTPTMQHTHAHIPRTEGTFLGSVVLPMWPTPYSTPLLSPQIMEQLELSFPLR